MNEYYVYEDNVVIYKIKADEVEIHSSGSLIFRDKHYDIIEALRDGLWDGVKLQNRD